jgi:hypothetical protein
LAFAWRSARVRRGCADDRCRRASHDRLGIVIGLPIAWLASRAIAKLVFGVTTTDPITIALRSRSSDRSASHRRRSRLGALRRSIPRVDHVE